MRGDSTKAENRLRQALRGGKLEGVKFKRQVPIDDDSLDFDCFEPRLFIEVDGRQHAENLRDIVRDAHFRASRFRTLRFWSREIERDLAFACLHILPELKPPASFRPSACG